MAACKCNKLRCGSGVLLGLCLASWVIALGGLGAINWLVCSDYDNTSKDIAANLDANFNTTNNPASAEGISLQLNIPTEATAAAHDVSICSRSWRWEWFCLFFQFAVMLSAMIVTVMPSRLARARFPLGNMFVIATAIIMVAVNEDITDVWFFWDNHRTFSAWTGVLQKLYLSAAALVAGWILVIFFNIVWIGFTQNHEEETKETKTAVTV